MKAFPTNHLKLRGAALMAILWIVAILSIAVFSATQFLFIELESESNASSIFRAEQLADQGIALAAHPNTKQGDPLLTQQISDTESFFARISSEGERLNLNALLENPEDDRIVLDELFTRWGLRFDESQEVVDALIDWVDEDDEPTNSGAEKDLYLGLERTNQPFNRPFEVLEEAEMVYGFQRVIAANPDWKEAFTLMSSGALDLNEAPAELIVVACECGEAAAEQLVEIRNGFDGIRGTLDDEPFGDVETALQILAVPTGFEERISARVSVKDEAKRLVSVGRFGTIAVERIVTVQYTGDRGEIRQWKTRRVE
ncbi:MAG: type II secretion system protein GspK [Verrucomicrobiales bacterium]|nr:type II secretion system protein GspK [Verrucomicrobiales bacterium]